MLSTNNRIIETIAAAPGTATFNLPGAAKAGGNRTWLNGITTAIGTGVRAVPYVACDNSSLFEIAVGYYDPAGNGGNGTITRAAPCVLDGSSGRGNLVNFTSGNVDVFADMNAVLLTYGGIDSYFSSEMFEDFWGGINAHRFNVANSGTGSGQSTPTPVNGHGYMGLVQASTGTTATGSCSLYLPSSLTSLGEGIAVYETLLSVSTLSTGADTFDVRAGFVGNVTADANNTIWFAHGVSPEAGGVTVGNWGLCSRVSGTRTLVDSGVAVSTVNFQRLRIELRHDGSRADFFIDGNNVGNITTNLPTTTDASAPALGIVKASGTNARTLIVDSCYFGYLPTAKRN